MMKNIFLFFVLLVLSACQTVIVPPQDFVYKEIKTQSFVLASWQKIKNPNIGYKIYVEGDGNAFSSRGYPTNNPTPRSIMLREIAFGDAYPNVIYLARPCQYVEDDKCEQKYWTTGRFAPEVITATSQAIKQIAKDNEVVLIGFSGGAQVAGLAAIGGSNINVSKIITIAGNLDHKAWCEYLNLTLLKDSMNLADYSEEFFAIKQLHLVGEKDKVIEPFLVKDFVGNNAQVIVIKSATHNKGWQEAYKYIHD